VLWDYFEKRYEGYEIKRLAYRTEETNFKKVEVVLKIVRIFTLIILCFSD